MTFSKRFTTTNIVLAFLILNFITLGIVIGVINFHFEEQNETNGLFSRQHAQSQSSIKNITTITLKDLRIIMAEMNRLFNHTVTNSNSL